jgi:hypothetical protein
MSKYFSDKFCLFANISEFYIFYSFVFLCDGSVFIIQHNNNLRRIELLHKTSWIIRVSLAFSTLLIGWRCNQFRKHLTALCLCSGGWHASASIIVSVVAGFLHTPI